jgi:hypothetical protein
MPLLFSPCASGTAKQQSNTQSTSEKQISRHAFHLTAVHGDDVFTLRSLVLFLEQRIGAFAGTNGSLPKP